MDRKIQEALAVLKAAGISTEKAEAELRRKEQKEAVAAAYEKLTKKMAEIISADFPVLAGKVQIKLAGSSTGAGSSKVSIPAHLRKKGFKVAPEKTKQNAAGRLVAAPGSFYLIETPTGAKYRTQNVTRLAREQGWI